MPRRLLIVHGSRAERAGLRRQVLAEMPDVLVHEAGSTGEATAKLRCGGFEFVLFDDGLCGDDGVAAMGSLALTLPSPPAFVGLVAPGFVSLRADALTARRVHVVVPPFTDGQLSACLATASDPRRMRTHRRHVVPGAIAELTVGHLAVRAEVVNISLSGVLCEFQYDARLGNPLRPIPITLEVPGGHRAALRVDGLVGRVVTLSVLSRTTGHEPSLVRAALQFLPIDADVEKALEDAVGVALNQPA